MRTIFVAVAFAVGVAASGSGCGKESCLRGDCEAVRACRALDFPCDPGGFYAGPVGDAPAALRLAHGQGAIDDLLLSNGVVTVVIDAIDEPHGLAPTGGNVIDLGPAGGADDLNLVYQIAGVLPDDAFAYTSIDVVEGDGYVAAIARGTLDGRPDVEVLTRYELGACDPGVRVRSELFNGSADVHAWVVADVPHWGKRRAIPFAPAPGQGWVTPELDLLELDALYDRFPYGAAAATATDSPGYAVAACNQRRLEGINDLEISALGTARQLVHPGETVILERFWATAGAGQGPAPAIAHAASVRDLLAGDRVVVVQGRVVAGGVGFGGHARRASIVVSAGDTPLSSVTPGEDGTFAATVPLRPDLRYELASFGRTVATGAVGDDGVVGDVAIEPPATLVVDVAGAEDAIAVLWPADDATFDAVRGSFHGQFGECAPWLGPPHGGSPACNRILVGGGTAEVEVPAGRYDVYATAGPDHTLARARDVELVAGELATVTLTLAPLDVVPAGWLSADLHVHGRASFDSAIPDLDRVRSFLAAGVDVIAATDHDHVTDYADAVAALGAGDRVVVLGGIETTQLIPWLDVPGEDVPKVIGHFNFWPIEPVPGGPRGGAPWDELVEPGALFDRMAPLVGDDGVMMINHPWDEAASGRDLGYLRAIGFDPRAPIDGDRHNELLLRAPGGGHRNLDWDVMEVQNAAGVEEFVKARPLWWSLISQGYPTAGAANSDSHGLGDSQLGWPRTLVETGGDLASFDAAAFDAALRGGRATGGTGIVVLVEIVDAGGARVRGLGLEPWTPAPGQRVRVEVRAAPWIPVEELRVVSAAGVRVLSDALAAPPDPFGTDGVVRFSDTFDVADLVDGGDDWFVIEAGLPLPGYEDLDDDGVPDTGDNDGDGDVDRDDVEPGEDAGPLRDPPDPARDAEDDPRFLLTRVVPLGYPVAFTSPILVDHDGDGWEPPGVAP